MQFRMVARRAPTGSLTVLGDLAQATGAWSYDSWDEIGAHLPRRPAPIDELTLGYRAPGQTSSWRRSCFPWRRRRCGPTRSIRQGRREPRFCGRGGAASGRERARGDQPG